MARRRGPSMHVLVAGDEHDLPAVQQLLQDLPRDCYGQVLLEASPEATAALEDVPPRCSVVALGIPRDDAAAGAALAQALTAWAGEWMVDGGRWLHERHELWVGARDSRDVSVVREVLLADCCRHVHTFEVSAAVTAAHDDGLTRY